MTHAIYIGPDKSLQGKGAIIEFYAASVPYTSKRGNVSWVPLIEFQLDDRQHHNGFGWTADLIINWHIRNDNKPQHPKRRKK